MADGILVDTRKLDDLLRDLGDRETLSFKVSDGVSYGVFQELAQSGHPSLIPALERLKREIPARIGSAVEEGQSLGEVMRQFADDVAEDWRSDVNVHTGKYRDSIHVEEA